MTKPVVFYGTSITQGECASRPGMAFTAIAGRYAGVPIINLGFSESGKMEMTMVAFLAEIDAPVKWRGFCGWLPPKRLGNDE